MSENLYWIESVSLATLHRDCQNLFPLHWEEVAAHEEVPLDPDWDGYARAEENGSLWCWVCYDDMTPIGYAAFTKIVHMHYKSTPYANNDVIYILPQHRGKKLGALLVETVESFLAEQDIRVIRWHIKTFLDWSKLLEAKGYEFTDKILEKVL